MNKNRLLQKEECVIRNSFWNRYIDLVKNMVIPYQWDILNDRREDAEPSHAIDNLRIAGGKMKGHFYGQVFQDSDVYKWLEAVGNMSDQKVLELTGCTVEEMLYLINKDTPVIGVRNGASAIILTGYDESHVTYVDSENGESKTVTQEEMDQIMQSSGNAYVGYLKKVEE